MTVGELKKFINDPENEISNDSEVIIFDERTLEEISEQDKKILDIPKITSHNHKLVICTHDPKEKK